MSSVIAQLIAELAEACPHCGGTGVKSYPATPTFVRMQRRALTAQGIAVPQQPATELPADRIEATCIDCRGRGTQLSPLGNMLRNELRTLLADDFAAHDHGHSVS